MTFFMPKKYKMSVEKGKGEVKLYFRNHKIINQRISLMTPLSSNFEKIRSSFDFGYLLFWTKKKLEKQTLIF